MKIDENQTDWSGIQSTKIYKIKALSKIWLTLYLTVSISMITCFIYFLSSIDSSGFWIAAVFILPISVALGVLAFLSISHLTTRLIITNSTITYINIFRSKQIAFHDIKGFRVVSTAQKSDVGWPGWEIEIESTAGSIMTVPKSIENQEELIAFLRSGFKSLDEDAMNFYLKMN